MSIVSIVAVICTITMSISVIVRTFIICIKLKLWEERMKIEPMNQKRIEEGPGR